MASDLPANLSIEHLLQNAKALEPLSTEALKELEEIEKLEVLNFSEADVREEVITPVLRVLGYKKQTDFSVDREKHLKLVNDDLFVDYTLTLWKAHFWVIEAKRVKRKKLAFIGSEVKQALVYAAHPEIDAPLLVLCDGRMFHVYDREVSLIEPIVKVSIKNLRKGIDKLRSVLSPWQQWFFQKRRVLRLIDKVFDREFNLERLSEFRTLVDVRLPDYLQIANEPLAASMALKRLIPLCLTNFEADSGRRTVLLYSAAARRIAKQFLLSIPDASVAAERQHALLRFHGPELDFAQFCSSPAAHLGHFLTQMELAQTQQFVATLLDDRNRFQDERAKQGLRDLWASERKMLGDGSRYRATRDGRELEDSPWSEVVAIGYDQLGHMALCVLTQFPKWKAWAMEHHRAAVEVLAAYGSWQAKEWLGLQFNADIPRPPPSEVAKRFFMGDEDLLQALARGYGVGL